MKGFTLNESVIAFHNRLEELRKPEPHTIDYDDRVNHCYLIYNHENKDHIFQVRGWFYGDDGSLVVSAVNWTLTAGYCHVELTGANVAKFKISKEYPL